jgi:hypothetical protein
MSGLPESADWGIRYSITSSSSVWPRADDLLDHIRLLARERGQPFDVIDSAMRTVRIHAQ